ncbi:F0F1 ATP synthase subunit B [Vibrio harveyi]|nr:F0F1 ATP synthase subunit B [Vibrio harveyi]
MNINATLPRSSNLVRTICVVLHEVCIPPLMQAIEERQKKIADGLQAAERAAKDLDLAQANASDQMKEAKRTATEIIDQANKRKSQIIDEAREEAQAERQKILAQAEAELEAERNRARDELRKQVATLAVAGAEKILERTIDKDAQKDILDNITAKL